MSRDRMAVSEEVEVILSTPDKGRWSARPPLRELYERWQAWFCSPQFISYAVARRTVLRNVIPYLHGVLLDLGAGAMPYRDSFAPYVARHVGLEYPPYYRGLGVEPTSADCFGDGRALPLRDASCDIVVATEVLSYVDGFEETVAEVSRVLKPGGTFIVTDRLVYPLRDAMNDRCRLTPTGCRTVLKRCGFRVERVVPLSGFWGTIALLVNLYLFKDVFGYDRVLGGTSSDALRLALCSVALPFLVAWCGLVNCVCLALDRLHPVSRFTHGWLLIACKT